MIKYEQTNQKNHQIKFLVINGHQKVERFMSHILQPQLNYKLEVYKNKNNFKGE